MSGNVKSIQASKSTTKKVENISVLGKTTFYIPAYIYDKARNENFLRSLAYYVVFRRLNNFDGYLNLSKEEIAKQTNNSLNTITTHLTILINKGLVRKINKNQYHFIALRKLLLDAPDKSRKKYKEYTNQYGEVKRFKYKRKLILGFNLYDNVNENLLILRSFIGRNSLYMQHKKVNKRIKSPSKDGKNSYYSMLTTNNVAKSNNCSKMTASRDLKKLSEIGVIKRERMFQSFDHSKEEFLFAKKEGLIPSHSIYCSSKSKIIIEKPAYVSLVDSNEQSRRSIYNFNGLFSLKDLSDTIFEKCKSNSKFYYDKTEFKKDTSKIIDSAMYQELNSIYNSSKINKNIGNGIDSKLIEEQINNRLNRKKRDIQKSLKQKSNIYKNVYIKDIFKQKEYVTLNYAKKIANGRSKLSNYTLNKIGLMPKAYTLIDVFIPIMKKKKRIVKKLYLRCDVIKKLEEIQRYKRNPSRR